MSDDVKGWLESFGLGKYAEVFAENEIDFRALPRLSEDDLKELGLPIGARRSLQAAIAQLSEQETGPTPAALPGSTTSSEAERRQLTVMFCDLVGSTALSEALDPEELRELLALYQDNCASIVARFGGYIGRYVGDGLLVYFGYPQAHEDDAERAVRAGLGIVEALRTLAEKFARAEVSLAVRVGITTGLVVVGDIGRGERRERMAVVGKTPNIAARLQGLADPGTVVIGAPTKRLVEGLFVCDHLGPREVNGLSKPVSAYRVSAESGVPSRFEAMATRGLAPMIGRQEEVGLLLKRWEQSKAGESQIVLLAADPGVGKSRIVRSFQERTEGELRNRLLYFCSPYFKNSALYPVIDQLERGLRFEKSDRPAQKLDKLEAVLSDLNLPVAEAAPVLASLLSLPTDERYPAATLSALELKKTTFETLLRMVDAMAARNPVLMVVEDMHWIDPSTLEFIDLLVEQLGEHRFLLVATYRPGFEPPWEGRPWVTLLRLNHLSREESAAMVANVAQGKALPGEVFDQIIAKTDGVPLFVEELAKTLLESDLLEDLGDRYVLHGPLRPLAIPESLQDSMMARLDRLARGKKVAQLAATVGRSFGRELLGAVSRLNEHELEEALSELVRAELVFRRGLAPNVTYEFKHALVQDAAYQSLLKTTQQQFHQRIADVLEERFPQTVKTQPETLAHHYTEAQRPEKAIDYWLRAGRRASSRSANVEAIAHLSKGLELIGGMPETPERAEQEIDFHLVLGPAWMSIKGLAASEAKQTYSRARDLCRRVGKSLELFAATWGLWLVSQQQGQVDTAQQLADEVLALAEHQEDPALRLQAHHAAWTTHYRLSEFLTCREHAEQGIALYNIEEHHSHAFRYGGHDPGVCACIHAARTLWFLGFPDQARNRTREAIDLAEQLSHPFSLALAHNFSATFHQYCKDTCLVREHTEAAMSLCAERGVAPEFAAMGRVLHGWALVATGHAEEGIEAMRQGLMAYQLTGKRAHQPYMFTLLAEAYGDTAQLDEGLIVLAEALELVEETGERTFEAEIHRLKGELLLKRSAQNRAEAVDCFHQAADVARHQQSKSLELRVAMSRSRLILNQGKRSEAHDLLAPVYDWFTEGFDTADLKEAKTLLEKLS